MSRVWLREPLETMATFWRVLRRDGVTLGFTTHDHDLWFDGVLHRAAPGMAPSAIRRSADFEPDSADVQGALSHDSIAAADLAAGRFDGAQVRIGVVDWQTNEARVLYRGAIGGVTEEAGQFTAELVSRKAELLRDPVPRTSPSCRAAFCGPGCNIDPAGFSHEATVASVDAGVNALGLSGGTGADLLPGGMLRWLDGPHAGTMMTMVGLSGARLIVDWPLDPGVTAGLRVLVREGCDHTIGTCATRFANAVNFRGEPFLPGNDMISRYPNPAG